MRRRVGGICHGRVNVAGNAVLGTEQRHELHARRVREHIDRPPSRRIDARLIRDQTHALSAKRREIFLFEHVDTRPRARARSVR